MSDPFTDFMTGHVSQRLARFEKAFYGFLYVALAGGVLALGAVILLT